MKLFFNFYLFALLLLNFINATNKKDYSEKSSSNSTAELRDKIMNPFSDVWLISYSNVFHVIDTEGSNKLVNQTKINFKTSMPISQETMLLLGFKTGVRVNSQSSNFLGLNFETTSIKIRVAKKFNERYSYAFGAILALPNGEDYNNSDKLNSDITISPNVYFRYDGNLIDVHFGFAHSFDIIDTDNIRRATTQMFAGIAAPVMDSSDISIGTHIKYDWTEIKGERIDIPLFIGYNFLTFIFGKPIQLRLGTGRKIIKASTTNSETFFFVSISPILKH